MANLRQAKTEDEIKKLTVNNVKKAYHDLALDYNHLLDLDYIYCPHCGKWKSTKGKSSNYYISNKSKSGFEHFACKSCILDMCTDVEPKSGVRIDNREKTIDTFRRLDWKFSENDYNAQLQAINENVGEKVRGTAVQNLIVMVASLPQYRNTSFRDSEFVIDDEENNTEANIKIVQKTLKSARKRFGNYNSEDLMYLENEYQDWTTRYPCENKAQELLFKRICFKELEIDKAQKSGKDTKELDATLQNLMGSLNVKPSQKTSNTLTDNLTFGQLIDKWEQEKPIPEPDEEFKDVDKIGLYIDVFFKGHLSKMMGLKNAFSSLYEKFMSKYTVTKPQYDEDFDSEALFDQIFGSKMDDE